MSTPAVQTDTDRGVNRDGTPASGTGAPLAANGASNAALNTDVTAEDKSDDARLFEALRSDGDSAWLREESLRAWRRRFGECDELRLPSSASMLARRVKSVLQRGPSTDHEHALARALAALALREQTAISAPKNLDDLAREVLFLARDTPWDATGLVDAALGADAESLWFAIVSRLRILVDRADPPTVRAELLVGASALIRSAHPQAIEGVSKLRAAVRDPAIRSILALGEEHQAPVVVEGIWQPASAEGFFRLLLLVTGFTILQAVWRAVDHVLLGRRRNARIEWRSGRLLITCAESLGGRASSSTTLALAPDAIARIGWASKRTGMLGGVFVALAAAGTFAGTFFAVVGARIQVASFFSGGMGLMGLALLLDQAPLQMLGAVGGRGRLTITPRNGETIVVHVRDSEHVDALLQRWASTS